MGCLKVEADGTVRQVGCGGPSAGRLKLYADGQVWQERCDSDDFTDDFNRSPALTTALQHTFTGSNGSAVGAADTGQPVVANPGWTISGNTAVDLTTVNESFLVFDSGSPDGTFTATLTAVPTMGDGGLVVRTDASGNNCWLLNVEAGSRYALYKRVSGGYTFMTAVAKVPAVSDVLQIECAGNDLTPSVGGVFGATITDTTHATQQLIGVRASNAFSAKDIAFDNLTAARVYAPIGNGWTVYTGEIISGEAKGTFAREVGSNNYDLTFTVPNSIDNYIEIGFGMLSGDSAPPNEFHLLTIGNAFAGIVQIHYRDSAGFLSAYNHTTQPCAVSPGDEIRLRVTEDHIWCYVEGVQVEDAPLATPYLGTWLWMTTTPSSTTTVDDLTISPLGRSLKIYDGTTTRTVCMIPA